MTRKEKSKEKQVVEETKSNEKSALGTRPKMNIEREDSSNRKTEPRLKSPKKNQDQESLTDKRETTLKCDRSKNQRITEQRLSTVLDEIAKQQQKCENAKQPSGKLWNWIRDTMDTRQRGQRDYHKYLAKNQYKELDKREWRIDDSKKRREKARAKSVEVKRALEPLPDTSTSQDSGPDNQRLNTDNIKTEDGKQQTNDTRQALEPLQDTSTSQDSGTEDQKAQHKP